MHDLGTWGPGHHSPPQLLLCQTCLTCKPLLLSLSLFPPPVASCCLSLPCVLLLLLQLILYLFFLLFLHFSPPLLSSYLLPLLSSPKARHYYQVIKRPMDLSIIRRKLQKKDPAHYTTPEEVVSDVRLMFWNCAKFNYVRLPCFPSSLFPVNPRTVMAG